MTSFWRYNDVIITSCVQRACTLIIRWLSTHGLVTVILNYSIGAPHFESISDGVIWHMIANWQPLHLFWSNRSRKWPVGFYSRYIHVCIHRPVCLPACLPIHQIHSIHPSIQSSSIHTFDCPSDLSTQSIKPIHPTDPTIRYEHIRWTSKMNHRASLLDFNTFIDTYVFWCLAKDMLCYGISRFSIHVPGMLLKFRDWIIVPAWVSSNEPSSVMWPVTRHLRYPCFQLEISHWNNNYTESTEYVISAQNQHFIFIFHHYHAYLPEKDFQTQVWQLSYSWSH